MPRLEAHPSARPPDAARPQHKARAATITRRKIQHMQEGDTQLGTVLTDQRPEDSEGDGVIVVGLFKGDPYDGGQLSYAALAQPGPCSSERVDGINPGGHPSRQATVG
jgi:hypothetical protein